MFHLPKLSFSFSDLQPWLSPRAVELHYTDHHHGYLDTLNDLTWRTPKENLPLDMLMEDPNQRIANMALQHVNHSFFWSCLSAPTQDIPDSLYRDIRYNFGDLDGLKAEFKKHVDTLFGSGWVWLVCNQSNILSVMPTSNGDNPNLINYQPLLVLDVWEHAYYLDHQNDKQKYLDGFWSHVNWSFASQVRP